MDTSGFFDWFQLISGWIALGILGVEGLRRARRLLQRRRRLSHSARTTAVRCIVITVAAALGVIFVFEPAVHSTRWKIVLALLLAALAAVEIWAEISDFRHSPESAQKPALSRLVEEGPPPPRGFVVADEDLFNRLHPYLQKGVDILNAGRSSSDAALVQRAREKWMREVRSLTEVTHPDFALYFVPQHPTGREPSMRLLVQRLSRFLKELG